MRRRAQEEREPDAREERSTPAAPAPAAFIARLQQTAGNRAVTALLSRQPLEYDTEPHEGGDASDLLGLLEPPEQVAELADAPEVAAPAAAADPVGDWTAKAPATNAEYAQWIIDGVAHGFVIWSPGMGAQKQMEDLAAGKTVKGTDPAKPAILGSLKTIKSLVGARVTKWRGDETKPKDPLSVGSFLRGAGAHGGRAIDINGFDWTGTNGPAQVEEALRALPAGSYGIGLPFQGQFFPKDEWLDERKKAAGDPPADITQPSLQKFVGTRYTSAYKDGEWHDAKAGGQAIDRLKSSTLKAAIAELNGKGYTIYVFPDNNNHIHIQSP
jgi:hypothetical protein